MITLKKELKDFNFFKREKKNDKYVSNKCGRDFLYFCLNFYFPEKFNKEPLSIDNKLGIPVKPFFAWTQIQFNKTPKFLKENNLTLKINNKEIRNFFNFFTTIIFSKIRYENAIKNIEESILNNCACGVDVSLGLFGLLDHVMFVYGYDDENLYILDTHNVSKLEYEKTENSFLYKLPKKIIKKRWTRFGRFWKVEKI